MKLTQSQQAIGQNILDCIDNRSRCEVLAGLAGTGKTTVAKWVYDQITSQGNRPLVVAPTGKAAMVLRSKDVPAVTIHQAIYRYGGKKETDRGDTELIFLHNHKRLMCDLIIVDEASMVGIRQYRDIMEKGIPTLWVGDPGQLPPIKSQNPGLFKNAKHILKEIHRQAADSPVIQWAHQLRKGANLESPFPGITHLEVNGGGGQYVARQILDRGIDRMVVKTNKQRVAINQRVRAKLGFSDPFHVGDKIVCLRNNRKLNTVNGQVFEVTEVLDELIDSQLLTLKCCDTGDTYRHYVYTGQLHQEKAGDWDDLDSEMMIADYAYAMTCHKLQGSSARHIGIAARGYCGEPRTWNYTAATRAEEEVTVFC